MATDMAAYWDYDRQAYIMTKEQVEAQAAVYAEQTGWQLLEECLRRRLSPPSTSRVHLMDELARDDCRRAWRRAWRDEVPDGD